MNKMSNDVHEHNAIAKTLQHYIDGMKSGKGFYEWPDHGVAMREKRDVELIRYLKEDIERGKI